MRHSQISYRGGLQLVPREHREELIAALEHELPATNLGLARTLRENLTQSLMRNGWSSEAPVSRNTKITITSIKSRTALCFQTGNVARVYADLLKLQTLYTAGSIDAALFILPNMSLAKSLGSNIANAERLERELPVFSAVITVPMLIIGIG